MGGEGRANRLRGFQFERDCVNMAKMQGLKAERAWGSNGQSLGLTKEVDLLVQGVPLQAKRMKRASAKYLPDHEAGVVGQVFRQDRDIPYITIEYGLFLNLMLEIEELKESLSHVTD